MEPTPDSEIQIDLRDYLRVAIKRRWSIFAVFFIVFLGVAVHDFTATPIYQASTRMIIEKENPNVMSIQEVMAVDASGTDYYQTQYKILESRTIARMVIDRLNLAGNPEFAPKPEEGFLAELKQTTRATIGSWKEAIKSLLRSQDTVAETDAEESDTELVNAFLARVQIKPIRNSRLVDIGFEAKDPVLAARVANELARAYIDNSLDVRLQAIKDAMSWINERIAKERERVEESERALQKYRERHRIITEFSGEVETVTAQKLASLNQEVVAAESARVEAETKYKQARLLKDNPLVSGSIPEVLNNPLIQQIKKAEVDIYGRISELSRKYGANHPSMKAARSELASLEKRRGSEVLRIIDSLRNAFEVSRAREHSVKAALEKQKREALDLNKKAIEYGVLKREAESSREMYEILIKRFKETSVTEDINASNIRIIDRAETPRDPVKPRIKRNLLLALVVGLMLGIGLAFFLEYLDNSFKTPEEIEQLLQVPTLGLVPLFTGTGKGSEMGGKANPGGSDAVMDELVTARLSKSTASEAYRGIRTKILYSSAEAAPKKIMTTSSTAKEGKTITSANLAVTMAQSGSRVLLMDCDMRRPRLHRILGMKRDKGVSNVLVGESKLDEVIEETEIPNLSFISCGPIPPNPSELLGSKSMAEMLAALARDYDRIIIDTPPLSAVTDPTVLANLMDGVVVVVRANDTPRELVRTSMAGLNAINAKVLGVVLNSVDLDKNAYYYQYYYHYGYYAQEEGGGKQKSKRKRRVKKGGSGSTA